MINLRTKLVLRLAKRDDQALISICIILKFSALMSQTFYISNQVKYSKYKKNQRVTKSGFKDILTRKLEFEASFKILLRFDPIFLPYFHSFIYSTLEEIFYSRQHAACHLKYIKKIINLPRSESSPHIKPSPLNPILQKHLCLCLTAFLSHSENI